MKFLIRAALVITLLPPSLSSVTRADAAPAFKVLHHFSGKGQNGGTAPQAGVAFDKDGNLVGTTVKGGTGSNCGSDGCGTVFRLKKPPHGKTAWSYRVIHQFTNGTDDGALPFGALLLDDDGALIGTTNVGGFAGTVFKLTPSGKDKFTFSLLHTFKGGKKDGAFPSSDVVADADGALYVSAIESGASGDGVILRLTPPKSGTTWTPKVLHSFNASKGQGPGGLFIDSKGKIYGTTGEGGDNSIGVLYSLAPPAAGKSAWAYKVLHDFTGVPDGQFGGRALVKRPGVLYGTTIQGGANNTGTIFSYTLPTSKRPDGSYSVLHSFDFTEGSEIYSSLLYRAGTFYGVAVRGGANNKGTVFAFRPAGKGHAESLTVLHEFSGASDGEGPMGGLIADKNGVLYGTTSDGGKHGFGTVFSIKP